MSTTFPSAAFSTSDCYTQTTTSTRRLLDPEEQLVERWQTIGTQIASRRMSWDAVIAMNRHLDVVENILLSPAPLDEFWRTREEDSKQEISKMMSNPQLNSPFMSESMPPIHSDAPEEWRGSTDKRMTSQDDEAIVERVANAVTQLRNRQHEFKQLHDMAILKSERQAEKISQLMSQVDQLEKDVIDDESELSHLKLRLRIMEIQTLPYVPQSDQDDLEAEIQRWKLDWADVENRHRKRRWKRETGKRKA